MFQVTIESTKSIISSHSLKEDAELYLSAIETNPPTHKIIEVPDPIVEAPIEVTE